MDCEGNNMDELVMEFYKILIKTFFTRLLVIHGVQVCDIHKCTKDVLKKRSERREDYDDIRMFNSNSFLKTKANCNSNG